MIILTFYKQIINIISFLLIDFYFIVLNRIQKNGQKVEAEKSTKIFMIRKLNERPNIDLNMIGH